MKAWRACILAVGCGVPVLAAWGQDADVSAADRGKKLYNSYCARCHGLNMVNPGAGSFDLRTLGASEQDRFERSVTQGVRAMPAWGAILKPGDVQALWSYVMAVR